MRKAAEHFVERFPVTATDRDGWQFPTIDGGGDFLIDPATVCAEVDAIEKRGNA
ncbi:MAG UNVERIFIED_CONTAM: hypothetical protein LVR18_11460 [Planctomycetaceae bacterium]|jgi:hypothetical protein